MGNACSSGSGDRKGSDAYNPGSTYKNEIISSKSSKPSWRKISKSKDKGEKSTSSGEVEQKEESAEVSCTIAKDTVQQAFNSSHSKLEPKVSEDISNSSVPIVQLESVSKSEENELFVRNLNENVKALLLGKINSSESFICSKKVILYICSDHNEFIQEQFILRNQVYPDLRKFYADKGYELCLIDLHHKLKPEYLNDNCYSETCLKGLITCKREMCIIMVLMKEKLEFDTIPNQFSEVNFENLLNCASENEKSLLTTWYYLEKNMETPVYKLRHVTSCISSYTSGDPEERTKAVAKFKDDIDLIKEIVWKYSSDELRKVYFELETEKEINYIIKNPDLFRYCVMVSNFKANELNNPDQSSIKSQMKSMCLEKTENLRKNMENKLESSRIINMSSDTFEKDDSVNFFYEKSSSVLKSVCESILEENRLEKNSYNDLNERLASELILQSATCDRLSMGSTDIDACLERMKTYILSEAIEPFIVHGPSGCGKSSLLAKTAKLCAEWLPNSMIIYRTIGISVESSTEERISMSICHQCSNFCLPDNKAVRINNLDDYTSALPYLFSTICSIKPLIVIVDGIDQISDLSSSKYSWLPEELSPSVKVILSLSSESLQFSRVKEIIKNELSYFTMPHLSPSDALKSFIQDLAVHNLSLGEDHLNLIKETLNDCSLLFFKNMLVNSAKSWSSETSFEDISYGSDVKSQIEMELNTVERKFGKIRVGFALGFLSAVKYGLADSEIQDLLARNESKVLEEMEGFDLLHDVSPVLLWTQLKNSLSYLLAEFDFYGVQLSRWKSKTVFDIAFERYLKDTHSYTPHIKQVLIEYFQDSSHVAFDNASKKTTSEVDYRCLPERACSELPYQMYHANNSILDDFVFNFDWLKQKLSLCDTYQLIEDTVMCLTGDQSISDIDEKDVHLLKRFLETSHEALAYNGVQLLPQLYGQFHAFFQNKDNNLCHPKTKILYDNIYNSSFYPLLLPLNSANKESSTSEKPKEAHPNEFQTYNLLYRIANYPHHMILLSPAEGVITVWDILNQKAVRTLKNVKNPRDIQMIDEYNAIVLCNRELKIYNFDEGTLKMNIKGVMNQSMPYYGLHNHEHVVALSRNRMYVNMMNTQTGDLVTTFKVGEDRFLNSLIVSKNGKICVCGDQTQKPSPLLVWDLTSRKLMYDLRIPHHEFVTKLAAITDDGNYVVCVSKEVNNTTPNHVVVYDLQSGTLFKKWKPGANTCSIAISSAGNCVITALEDNTLSVWDLITGALRATLIGHSAPVSHISLSEEGTRFVTYDGKNKDRTVRLWDSTAGEVIATFTPDSPVLCCQLSAKGDFIVLGVDGAESIVTLALCEDPMNADNMSNLQSKDEDKTDFYGNEINHCKTFETY